jgi:hypothetical protein
MVRPNPDEIKLNWKYPIYMKLLQYNFINRTN